MGDGGWDLCIHPPSPISHARSRRDFDRYFPTERRDLALEVAHARLAGVFLDRYLQRRVGNVGVGGGERVLVQLLGQEVAPGNFQLFAQRVARKLNNLHAVEQRRRDGLQRVGGGDKHHRREIPRHVEVVVAERVILLGIEHFQQRGRRIAAKICAELVDLVEHKHRVVHTRAPDCLNDCAGQRADVGTPVPTNLGLVAHAAQRKANELAAHRARNRAAQAGFAHAGRPYKAQDRATWVGRQAQALLAQRAHGQVFQNARLDTLKVVVVLVEHLLGVRDIELVVAVLFPGQCQQGFEVGANHAILGGSGRHLRQPAQLAFGLRLCFGAHASLARGLAQARDLGGVLVSFAQLLANGAQLLAQQIFALVLVDAALHLRLDALPKLQHAQLAGQDLGQAGELGLHTAQRKNFLPLGHGAAEQERDRQQIHELARVVFVQQLGLQFFGRVGQQLKDLLGQADEVAHQCLRLKVVAAFVGQHAHTRANVWLGLQNFDDLDLFQALHRHAQRIIRQAQEPVHHRRRADLVVVASGNDRRALLLVFQRHQADHPLAQHGIVDQLDRLLLPDRQRDHG